MGSRLPKLTAEDKEWRAKDDVRTLAEAEKIKSDSGRLVAAKKMAQKMADEALKAANVMSEVAKGNTSKPTTKAKPKTVKRAKAKK